MNHKRSRSNWEEIKKNSKYNTTRKITYNIGNNDTIDTEREIARAFKIQFESIHRQNIFNIFGQQIRNEKDPHNT